MVLRLLNHLAIAKTPCVFLAVVRNTQLAVTGHVYSRQRSRLLMQVGRDGHGVMVFLVKRRGKNCCIMKTWVHCKSPVMFGTGFIIHDPRRQDFRCCSYRYRNTLIETGILDAILYLQSLFCCFQQKRNTVLLHVNVFELGSSCSCTRKPTAFHPAIIL